LHDVEVSKLQYLDLDIDNPKDVITDVANFFGGSDGWLNSIANA
jgi:hypothetical protein